MAVKWKYVMTIPGVAVPAPIEIADLALVGSEDDRYRSLKEENPVMSKYLDSFATMFGRRVSPSIVVRPANLPKVDASHLCSFRNAIAVPAVIYSRAGSCLSSDSEGFFCTDLFDFCPVSVSSDGSDLSIRTIHEIGASYDVEKFRGQVTPLVVHPEWIRSLYDEEFMKGLLHCVEWRV